MPCKNQPCDRVIRRFQSQEDRLPQIHLCGRCLRLWRPKFRLVDNAIGVCVALEMVKPILVRQRDELGEEQRGIFAATIRDQRTPPLAHTNRWSMALRGTLCCQIHFLLYSSYG